MALSDPTSPAGGDPSPAHTPPVQDPDGTTPGGSVADKSGCSTTLIGHDMFSMLSITLDRSMGGC